MVGPPRPRISACIVCRNEADRLPDCLDSARWADEIVVMDLSSGDGSKDIAERHGARVLTHAPVPIVELVRNEVAAEATGEWILALDPDERVTPGLARELRAVSEREDIDVVVVPVMNYDFGYPASTGLHRYDPKPRMYRKARVRWPTLPNKLPEVDEESVYRVPARDELVLVHDRNRTIAEALERVIRYGTAEAEAMVAAGETFTARRMVRAVAGKAHKQFVQARALDEGVPGLLRAFVLASFHFYVWACFWQLSGTGRTPGDDRFLRRLGVPLRLFKLATIPARARRRLARRRAEDA